MNPDEKELVRLFYIPTGEDFLKISEKLKDEKEKHKLALYFFGKKQLVDMFLHGINELDKLLRED